MIEALIYLGFLSFAAFQAQLRAVFARVALPYRLASAALIGFLVVGQLAASGSRTFPFVLWAMYTRSVPEDPVVFEVTAATQRGEDESLDVLAQAGRLGLRWPLLRAIQRHDRAESEAVRASAEQDLRAQLAAIVAAFNEHGTGVERVRVWRRRIPTDDYRGVDSIPRELLWEIDAQERAGGD